MNKERRKAIAAIVTDLEELRGKIGDISSAIEDIKAEEEDYKENLPESMQDGEKGQRADDAIGALDEAFYALDGIDFDEIVGYLETASE